MRHHYHLVEISPWPLLISLNLLYTLVGFVYYFTGYGLINYILSFILVLYIFILWLYDIITESLYLGFHTYLVTRALSYGFILFLLTEVMLFFTFFWGYFHSALNPVYLIWPPLGIDLVNPWGIPLLNTILLLYSGFFCTLAHHLFLSNSRKSAINYLIIGIILGIIFEFLQGLEYITSSFDISDSVYGSTFFMLTGLHGFHVIVGLVFLMISTIRIYKQNNPHLILDFALIYWHLVDIIWLGLYVFIYYLSY